MAAVSRSYHIYSCADVRISFSPQDNCYPISTIGCLDGRVPQDRKSDTKYLCAITKEGPEWTEPRKPILVQRYRLVTRRSRALSAPQIVARNISYSSIYGDPFIFPYGSVRNSIARLSAVAVGCPELHT